MKTTEYAPTTHNITIIFATTNTDIKCKRYKEYFIVDIPRRKKSLIQDF